MIFNKKNGATLQFAFRILYALVCMCWLTFISSFVSAITFVAGYMYAMIKWKHRSHRKFSAETSHRYLYYLFTWNMFALLNRYFMLSRFDNWYQTCPCCVEFSFFYDIILTQRNIWATKRQSVIDIGWWTYIYCDTYNETAAIDWYDFVTCNI